eukprot:TRINITY_DN29694_c0_g1_i1.p2 TRINITY_DN29694_c0_g1~~TRINITY_DN29694_c0_g1_i1.p2  ORF type:complete len:244 (-),score=23.63 TRINITY_DN29694_c0_g1_i1:185-916(-)
MWLCCALKLLVALLVVARAVLGVKLHVPPGQQECISETATAEAVQLETGVSLNVDGALQVITGNNKVNYNSRRYVDVLVKSPTGRAIFNRPKVWQEVKFTVKDQKQLGAYQLCITNSGIVRVEAIIDVAFFTVIHAEDVVSGINIPKGTENDRSQELASHEHLTQVHELVGRIDSNLRLLKGEQNYIKKRLDRHYETSTSTHDRARFYACMEVGVILLLTAVQVGTIHLMFRKHKSHRGLLGV